MERVGVAMKAAKRMVTVALLLFVGGTVGLLIAQEASAPALRAEETEAPVPAATEAQALPASQTVAADVAEENDGEAPAAAPPPAVTPCIVEAVYFHNAHRCVTCLKIEKEAKVAAERAFPQEFAEETLRWSAINMEEERRYIARYDLTKPTLILIRRVGGEVREWIALDETWALIRSGERFAAYIEESLEAFLEGCR